MIRALSFAAGAIAIIAASAIVLSGSERDRICRPGAAQAGRPQPEVWDRLRRAAFEKAGIPWFRREWKYEVDHIVPRCLDGPNTLDNLQVQRCDMWDTRNGHYVCVKGPAAIKDELEAETCRAYCSGKLTLDQARAKFRRD